MEKSTKLVAMPIAGLSEKCDDTHDQAIRTAAIAAHTFSQDSVAQHHLLETILQSTVDGICVADMGGKVVFQNRAMIEITGYSNGDLSVAEVPTSCGIYGSDQVTLLKADELPCQRAMRGERVRDQELYLRNARRTAGMWLRVNASTLCSDTGEIIGAVAIYRDATAQKRASAQQARLPEIVRTSAAPLAVVKLDGTILAWNQGAEQLLGYRAHEVIGHSVTLTMHSDRVADFERAKAEILRGVPVYHYETVRIHRDGTPIDVAMTVAPITNRTGKVVSLYGIMADIRDRKRSEHYLAELANNERQRLGRDLHDTLGQQLTGIGMLTQALKERLLKKTSTTDVLARLESTVEETKIQLRNILEGLSPVALDARGLAVALSELAEKARLEHGIDCRLDCDASISVADNFIATQFYYIAREAVHNAVVHARPRKIEIRFTCKNGFCLAVADDGCGLPDAATNSHGMGLHIMRYRSGLIGAVLNIRSPSAGGTLVVCELSPSPTHPNAARDTNEAN